MQRANSIKLLLGIERPDVQSLTVLVGDRIRISGADLKRNNDGLFQLIELDDLGWGVNSNNGGGAPLQLAKVEVTVMDAHAVIHRHTIIYERLIRIEATTGGGGQLAYQSHNPAAEGTPTRLYMSCTFRHLRAHVHLLVVDDFSGEEEAEVGGWSPPVMVRSIHSIYLPC